MGLFYGFAKKAENRGRQDRVTLYRVLAVLIPALLHGAYDYIASMERGNLFFIAFIAVLFTVSYRLVVAMSRDDQYI